MEENPRGDAACNIKIIIAGDSGAGKTSIIERYIKGTYYENRVATISPEFLTKVIKLSESTFRFNFWDLPGQDKNPVITSVFCKDSNGIIFCCDVSNEKSRENLKKWDNSIKNFNDISNIPKIILENKCDILIDEKNYNDNIEPLRQISDELDCINFFRVSALNGYNINESIDFLINDIINSLDSKDIQVYQSFMVKTTKKEDKTKCC